MKSSRKIRYFILGFFKLEISMGYEKTKVIICIKVMKGMGMEK